MVIQGYAHRIGDNITSQQILDPQWHDSDDPAVFSAHCLETIDATIAEHVREGDVLLAGQNFAFGADHDYAILALQALGIVAVICHNADPQAIEAANIYGLPIFELDTQIPAGAIVRINLKTGEIHDRTNKQRYQATPCNEQLLQAIQRAQLLKQTHRWLLDEGLDG